MNFWDASALVPVLVAEKQSSMVTAIAKRDPNVVLWWATRVECTSALIRKSREGRLGSMNLEGIQRRLADLDDDAIKVEPTEWIRQRAERLLGVHNLMSSDALQLAAALAWCRESTSGSGFVCLDGKLREAARKEGFSLFPVS